MSHKLNPAQRDHRNDSFVDEVPQKKLPSLFMPLRLVAN